MSYPPALLVVLENTLASTRLCIDDLQALDIGDWHAAVLLDATTLLASFAPAQMNVRDQAENTPLEIAYRLNRATWIETLEALGAEGDKTLLDWKGVGSYLTHDKHVRIPRKRGAIKVLEQRYRQGRSLNDRDVRGNTPLHCLAANGDGKVVKYFCSRYMMFGLDLNAKNNEGHTARNVALLAGYPDIAELLLIREIDNYLGAAQIWQQMCGRCSSYSRT